MHDDAAPPPADAAAPPVKADKRVRLRPEVRRQQILAAALHEFSAAGFEGATVEKIARHCGLAKAGVYAHFDSKEQILETLLTEVLFAKSSIAQWRWVEGATLADTVDAYLDKVYQLIRLPQVQETFRLLITESGRQPERMHRWSERIFQPHALRRQQEMDECIARGLMADNAVSRKFSIASAPAVIAMMSYWMLDEQAAAHEVEQLRAAHRAMLLLTLSPESQR